MLSLGGTPNIRRRIRLEAGFPNLFETSQMATASFGTGSVCLFGHGIFGNGHHSSKETWIRVFIGVALVAISKAEIYRRKTNRSELKR